ncbi:GNAT family N-acetyltransferase [Mammaliicoccus sp. Dog046]|uniref:GNAT family N-acetyltransferase n=1 Tax=Mammaliicoccus sp. Dog046 TaxID=3034233 RepID=UPI002B25EF5A|nr:GNAT family N-acetyltransferase [Mammaliicoccus sp. Dog046]WQK86337.1 GNAT family N-acetyltransferase [Mammaliicoccus sp. Dog046]
MKENNKIKMVRVKKEEFDSFKNRAKISFIKGLEGAFPEHSQPEKIAPIPSEEDYDESFKSKDSETYYLWLNEENIGGVILNINKETHRNEVDVLYIDSKAVGKGIGTKVWDTIEKHYPETKVWELHTPYFEKRNIHFYINKCKFSITGFYKEVFKIDGQDKEIEFFKFEKFM